MMLNRCYTTPSLCDQVASRMRSIVQDAIEKQHGGHSGDSNSRQGEELLLHLDLSGCGTGMGMAGDDEHWLRYIGPALKAADAQVRFRSFVLLFGPSFVRLFVVRLF